MITELSNVFGISYKAMLFIFVLVVVWSAIWKLMAMWKAAKKGAIAWFIVFGLVNTVGILEILYIYVFSNMKTKDKIKKRKRR
jgi:heme A synthase